MLIDIPSLISHYNVGRVSGVIHAGAHIGEEREAYERLPCRNVLWIEGNSSLLPELEANVLPLGHKVANELLSATDGEELTFHLTNNNQSSSILEFGTHTEVSPDVWFIEDRTLFTKTLDTVVKEAEFTDFNFLNMDLQGAELLCLKGGADTISKLDYIYTEINEDYLYKDCVLLPELKDFLVDFELVNLLQAGAPERGPGWVGWGDGFYIRKSLL